MAEYRSLLERLNALKPSSVTLDTSTNALNIPATGLQPAQPQSREDALSERLQTLRNRRDEVESGNTPHPPPPPPPPYTEKAEGSPHGKPAAQPLPGSPTGPPRQGNDPTAAVPGTTVTAGLRPDEEDRLLDEILDGLDVEDDQWSLSNDDAEDSKSVEELLARLRIDPEAQPPKSPAVKAKDPTKDPDSDDSEGEEITREVGNITSQVLDELKLDGPAQPTEQAQAQPSWPLDPGVEVKTNRAPKVGSDSHNDDSDEDNDDIALPDASQDVHDRDGAPISLPRTPGGSDDDDETGLDLPAVPTALVDPAPPAEAPVSSFESSIESRLAALRGKLPVQTDMFGLPSAPTFQPEDHPVPGVVRKPGYTDEDQKTWCIVCLEDATVRCLGCEGDVYCARCWRECHVGPSAGYDERGHQWEKFDKRQL